MLLADPNAWDSRLAGHFSESALDCGTIVNLIQFYSVIFSAQFAQQSLCSSAVWAVGLAEDGNSVVVNDALGLGLCCGHGGWINARAEESA